MNTSPVAFSDEDDIEKNNVDAGNTFTLDDDDECIIEDVESDDDGVENLVTVSKNYRDSEANDDNNNDVHDQLPSVEEVKASKAYLPTARLIAASHRRKLYITIAAAALAAIVLSVVISVGVFKTSNKNNKKQSVNVEKVGRYEEVVQYIFSTKVSSLPSFQEALSPEHNAAAFISDGDAYNMTMTDIDEFGKRRFMERYVLALLYYQAGGDRWNDNYNFLSPFDHCTWHNEYSTPQGRFMKGVQCNDDGFVIHLDLSNNNLLSPVIPLEITYFKYLEKLHLFGNTIGGGIPDLRKLENLVSLGLMNLNLRGTIPASLGLLTKLTTLAIGQNQLSETLPDKISELTNLRILGLDGCGLKGQIYPLLKLHKLEALYLEDNHMTGEIYHNEWQNMKELDLSNNIISSRVPPNLFTNPNLHVIDLNHNMFFGSIPDEFVLNAGHEYIALQNNGIHGTLTDRIGYLGDLKHLDISGNKISGTIPDTIQLCTNMVSLATSGNSFEKQNLKDFFTPLKHLRDLSMKGNSFTGTLPDFFATMTNLRLLDLDGNLLRGTISTYFGTLPNLAVLMLNRNSLTGTIPSELSEIKRLEVLLLDGNDLTGGTKEICNAKELSHFTSDCYPSMKSEAGPEVDCRCCTLCCNDENPECNDRSWTSSYDPKSLYGYIRPAYEFSLDEAPEGWQKKAAAEVAKSSVSGSAVPDVPAFDYTDDGS